MALSAARAGAAWIALTLSAPATDAATQARPAAQVPVVEPGPGPDPGAEGDRPPNVPEWGRSESKPGLRGKAHAAPQAAPEGAAEPPAPIRRADDTVVVCSILLHGEAAEVTGGAALDPGIARISGDGEAVRVVWSGVRIEGEEGQRRASCTAENQQVVSLVLDGEELLDGPQPY